MLDKKGLTLTLNMIVIVIISVTFLVLVLGFLTGYFPKLLNSMKGFPMLEQEPTADQPIQFMPIELKRGVQNKMTIGFYNKERKPIDETVIPSISCTNIGLINVEASGLAIPVGKSGTYSALVTIPEDTQPKQYSCKIIISETTDTFFITVI